MKSLKTVSNIIGECLNYIDNHQIDEISIAIMLDEKLSNEELKEIESDEYYGKLLQFIDSYFDAATHRFPEIIDGVNMELARTVLNEVESDLDNEQKKLSDMSWKIIDKVLNT